MYSELLRIPGNPGQRAVRSALVLLGHKFPKVRRVMAQRMYVKLVTFGDAIVGDAAKVRARVAA